MSTQIDSDSIQGASGGSWNWGSNTREIYVLYNDEIWDVKTLGAEETVHGPGTVYVRYRFYRYPNSNRTFPMPDSAYLLYDYDYKWKIRYSLISNKPEAKFSVSLDNDGDRVAMGYKESGKQRPYSRL